MSLNVFLAATNYNLPGIPTALIRLSKVTEKTRLKAHQQLADRAVPISTAFKGISSLRYSQAKGPKPQ